MNGERVRAGILGGLAGGVVFGMLMAMMGTLPMIAGLIGSKSALVGFVVHMLISAISGLGFGLILGGRVHSAGSSAGLMPLGLGALYGLAWWVLGPLVLMPLMMGMGTQFTNAFSAQNLTSLMGHLLFGGVLGLTYAALTARRVATAPQTY